MARKVKKFYNDIIVSISNSTKSVTFEPYVILPGTNVKVPIPTEKSNGSRHITKIQIAAIIELHKAGWKDSQIAAALRVTLNVASFHVAMYENPREEWKSIVEWQKSLKKNDIKKDLNDTEGAL